MITLSKGTKEVVLTVGGNGITVTRYSFVQGKFYRTGENLIIGTLSEVFALFQAKGYKQL